MSHRYAQRLGLWTHGDDVWSGYSGNGPGRNNPVMQAVHGVGPIPRGLWRIGMPYHHPHLGPLTMNLDPLPGTDALGRTVLRVHGNDAANDASHGCVVLGHPARLSIAAAVARGDNELEVVSGYEPMQVTT